MYSSRESKIFKKENFDVLNLANNHIMDLGIEGFIETLKVLIKNNLKFIGVKINLNKTIQY